MQTIKSNFEQTSTNNFQNHNENSGTLELSGLSSESGWHNGTGNSDSLAYTGNSDVSPRELVRMRKE
jgi:hypothetical protein